jgi:hypothetical protein
MLNSRPPPRPTTHSRQLPPEPCSPGDEGNLSKSLGAFGLSSGYMLPIHRYVRLFGQRNLSTAWFESFRRFDALASCAMNAMDVVLVLFRFFPISLLTFCALATDSIRFPCDILFFVFARFSNFLFFFVVRFTLHLHNELEKKANQ